MRGGRWAAVLLLAGCAGSRGDVVRLEERVRELQDEVYLLRREREELSAQLEGRRASPSIREPAPGPRQGRPRVVEPVEAVPEPTRTTPVEPERSAGVVAQSSGPAGAAKRQDLEEGRRAFEQGRHRLAVEALERYLDAAGQPSSLEPPADSVKARYLLAESYYGLGEFPQAIVEYGRVVEGGSDPTQVAESLLKIALSYFELGFKDNALEHLDRLTRSHPGSRAAEAAAPLRRKLGG